jgi:putative sigma-54 modulation protein
MRLEIRSQGFVLTEAIRAYIRRRMEFAVDRFAGRIPSLSVRIADLNGPRGSQKKRCMVELTLVPVGKVVIDEKGSDVYALVDKASDRLGTSIGRLINKSRPRRTASIRHWKPPDTANAA